MYVLDSRARQRSAAIWRSHISILTGPVQSPPGACGTAPWPRANRQLRGRTPSTACGTGSCAVDTQPCERVCHGAAMVTASSATHSALEQLVLRACYVLESQAPSTTIVAAWPLHRDSVHDPCRLQGLCCGVVWPRVELQRGVVPAPLRSALVDAPGTSPVPARYQPAPVRFSRCGS